MNGSNRPYIHVFVMKVMQISLVKGQKHNAACSRANTCNKKPVI